MNINAISASTTKVVSASDQLFQVQELVKNRPESKQATLDLISALKALQNESHGDWESAAKNWLEVLKTDAASLGNQAFSGWLKAQGQLLQEPVQAEYLSRLLWAQTDNGLQSPWLRAQGLLDLQRITQRIKNLSSSEEKSSKDWPSSPSAIVDDPLWEKASKLSCKHEMPEIWSQWYKSLSLSQRNYWDGLQAFCQMDYAAAQQYLGQAIVTFKRNPKTWPLALNAAEKLVSLGKLLGQRQETAKAYQVLAVMLSESETLTAKTGWNLFEIWRKRIDTWFWVARSQALLGQYQNAKIAVQEGFQQINTAILSLSGTTDQQKQIISDLRADGYHILASRIAYEERDYLGAMSLNRLAQDNVALSLEWRQRLQWAEGWYAFAANDRKRAVGVWQSLIVTSKDEAKPKIYYWLGRAMLEMGQKENAADYFQKLSSSYPLSFYTVVGLAAIDPKSQFQNQSGSLANLKEILAEKMAFSWEGYSLDAEGKRRLLRLELAIAAGLSQWFSPLALELHRYIIGRPQLIAELPVSLYASRLLHMSGAHLLAISLTTQLVAQQANFWENYPEQILIHFPSPYREEFQQAANQNGIEFELTLALSRQESSFQASAVSPAGAIGLMQLMSATAQKQAGLLGIELSRPQEVLKEPALNINIGTAYLAELGRRYHGNLHQAIAAYNAGEFVVDAWIKRRAADDPMLWIEALSYAETSEYVKNVWRNLVIYRWLQQSKSQ